MGQATADAVLDEALAKVASSTRLSVCSGQPANYAGIAAVLLAEVTLTAGDGNGDYVISDGDSDGRKVRIAAQSSITVDASGTATHVCLDDGTTLLYATICDAVALTTSEVVTVPAWDVEFGDPSTLGIITDLAVTPGDGEADLTWTAPAGATSQQPQYRASGTVTWTSFGAPLSGSAEAVTVTGLTNGTEYEFSVLASDA